LTLQAVEIGPSDVSFTKLKKGKQPQSAREFLYPVSRQPNSYTMAHIMERTVHQILMSQSFLITSYTLILAHITDARSGKQKTS